MGPRFDVVVAGGGVIGLACARALAARGARVALFDAGAGSKEASWAAAGILGIGSEFAADGPLFRAALEAFHGWPALAASLEAETGVALGWSDEGTLLVALDAAEATALDERAEVLATLGVGARPLTAGEARRVEPRLGPDVVAALRVGEARLDNRRLWEALRGSAERAGVALRDGEPVTGILVADEAARLGAVAGVRTPAEAVRADAVVVAAGAWSEGLARATGVSLPSVPVKGQMARLEAPDGFLRHVVKRGLSYAVPRRGAGLVVGTTSEEAGFSRATDDAVLARLVTEASRMVPSLAGLRRVEGWSGLRPRLADGLPAIGPVGGRPGLFLATGHFRTGILLCEWTGRAIARAVLDGDLRGLGAFSPDRPALAAGAASG